MFNSDSPKRKREEEESSDSEESEESDIFEDVFMPVKAFVKKVTIFFFLFEFSKAKAINQGAAK